MRFVNPILVALFMVGTTLAETPVKSQQAAERAPDGDEELALAAMEGLMAQPADRALPIIKRVLAGSQDERRSREEESGC